MSKGHETSRTIYVLENLHEKNPSALTWRVTPIKLGSTKNVLPKELPNILSFLHHFLQKSCVKLKFKVIGKHSLTKKVQAANFAQNFLQFFLPSVTQLKKVHILRKVV